jgi:ADP-heptose:LPS heptosyltransferase
MSIPSKALWVRLPRFIGDAVMISQALEPLRQAGYSLVAWGGAGLVELFEGSSAFSAVVADQPGKPKAWTMAAQLREHRASGVLCLPRSQRAILAGLLAGVRQRVGWADGVGWLLCSTSRSFSGLRGHQSERYAALLKGAFPDLPEAPIRHFVPRRESQVEADRLLEGLDRPFVAIGVGAMSWNKRVGIPVWVALGHLLAQRGVSLVLLGSGPEEQALARAIALAVPGTWDLTGRTSLSVTAAVLGRAGGVAGGDSALCHLAAACGVPTVTVFGPTDPEITAAPQPWVRVVRREDLACLPCKRLDCRSEGHPCMERVDPVVILAALEIAAEASTRGDTLRPACSSAGNSPPR